MLRRSQLRKMEELLSFAGNKVPTKIVGWRKGSFFASAISEGNGVRRQMDFTSRDCPNSSGRQPSFFRPSLPGLGNLVKALFPTAHAVG